MAFRVRLRGFVGDVFDQVRSGCEAGRARFGISDIDLVETLCVSVCQVSFGRLMEWGGKVSTCRVKPRAVPPGVRYTRIGLRQRALDATEAKLEGELDGACIFERRLESAMARWKRGGYPYGLSATREEFEKMTIRELRNEDEQLALRLAQDRRLDDLIERADRALERSRSPRGSSPITPSVG